MRLCALRGNEHAYGTSVVVLPAAAGEDLKLDQGSLE